jgi:hypothetical protein
LEDEVSAACSTHKRDENVRGKDHLEDLGVDVRKILK